MKDIFIDAIIPRLVLFFISASFLASYFMVTKTMPIMLFLLVLLLVLQLFKKAIDIANFEMSAKGEIVKILEDNATARSIDVHINANK